MKVSIEYDENDIDDKDIITLKNVLEKASEYEESKSETWSHKFIDDFELDVLSYVYQTNHELLELITTKFLGADKINFIKSLSFEVEDGTLLKAFSFSQYVKKIKPYFGKLKGFFRKQKKKKPLVIKEKVLYNPETKELLTNKDFDQINKVITNFLSDRLKDADEEFAVKAGILGLLAKRMEKEGIPKSKAENMSYEDLEKKYGTIPDNIKDAKKKYKLSDKKVRSIQYAKERAGELIRIPEGKVRNNIVSAVRQHVVQGLEEGISSNQLAQRLFYADTFDKVPESLKNQNIDAVNRDWRRVATTELSISKNNGYIHSLLDEAEVGESKYAYFDGHWSVDDKPGSKTDCNKWLGTIVRLVEDPRDSGRITGDPYAKYAVWTGKMNTDGNATPSIPVHPHCYSSDTKVLTNNGWKFFKDVEKYDLIFSLNPDTMKMEFVKWIDKVSYKHKGRMIHFKSKTYDCLVTKFHDMIVGKRIRNKNNHNGRKYEIVKAFKVFDSYKEFFMIRTGKWKSKNDEKYSEEYIKLWAWYISEGHKTKNGVRITQYIEENRKKIKKILDILCFDYTIENQGFYIKENIFTREIHNAYRANKSFEKYIPEFIKDCDKELIRVFLDTYALGDGHIRMCDCFGYKSKEVVYFSSSDRIVSDLCELIFKVGKSPKVSLHVKKGTKQKHHNGIYKTNHDVWCVRENNGKDANFEMRENSTKGKVYSVDDYDDMVYCLELERNHILAFMRNGHTGWAGNCKHHWTEVDPTQFEVAVINKKNKKLDKKELQKKRNLKKEGDVFVQLIPIRPE